MAKQGQRYRILQPKHIPGRVRVGQQPSDRYISIIDGMRVEDIYGDVITASENVSYPRGVSPDHRHVRWIEEHPERFELLKPNK